MASPSTHLYGALGLSPTVATQTITNHLDRIEYLTNRASATDSRTSVSVTAGHVLIAGACAGIRRLVTEPELRRNYNISINYESYAMDTVEMVPPEVNDVEYKELTKRIRSFCVGYNAGRCRELHEALMAERLKKGSDALTADNYVRRVYIQVMREITSDMQDPGRLSQILDNKMRSEAKQHDCANTKARLHGEVNPDAKLLGDNYQATVHADLVKSLKREHGSSGTSSSAGPNMPQIAKECEEGGRGQLEGQDGQQGDR